jgi:hypothetical protein
MVWVWVFGGEGAARDSGERESKHTVCTYFLPAAAVYNVISHISHHPTHMLGFQLHAVSQNGASLLRVGAGLVLLCFRASGLSMCRPESGQMSYACYPRRPRGRASSTDRMGSTHPHGSFVRSFVGWKDAAEIAG